MTDAPERHADKARNLMLNRAVHDLDLTINGHDPEVDVPIKDGVWNKLDKLALQIEVPLQARIAELESVLHQQIGHIHRLQNTINSMTAHIRVDPNE